jgi:hypothetical protein
VLTDPVLGGPKTSGTATLLPTTHDFLTGVGVSVAAACMLTSHYLGSHVPDAVGSLIIASLLGSVASFMIYTNSAALGKH